MRPARRSARRRPAPAEVERQRHAAIRLARQHGRREILARARSVSVSPGRRRRALRARACHVPSGRGRSSVMPMRAAPRRAASWAGIDPRVVGHQDVAGAQQVRKVAHMRSARPSGAHVQQPGGVARAGGMLRDAIGREVEVELGEAHRSGGRRRHPAQQADERDRDQHRPGLADDLARRGIRDCRRRGRGTSTEVDDEPEPRTKAPRRAPAPGAATACRRRSPPARSAGTPHPRRAPAMAGATSTESAVPARMAARPPGEAEATLHHVAQHQRRADGQHAGGRDGGPAPPAPGTDRPARTRCRHGRSSSWRAGPSRGTGRRRCRPSAAQSSAVHQRRA